LLEPYTDIAKVREGRVERKWRGCGAVDDEERRGTWQNESKDMLLGSLIIDGEGSEGKT
jgi:hypothetical protein